MANNRLVDLKDSGQLLDIHFTRLVPDKRKRTAILKCLARSIKDIHRIAPQSWGTTAYEDCLRLNVGGVEGMTLYEDKLSLIVTGKFLTSSLKRFVQYEGDYGLISDCKLISLTKLSHFDKVYSAHQDAIFRAAKRRSKYFWPEAQSSSVIELLEMYNYPVPKPDHSFYSKSEGRRQSTFVDEVASGIEGGRKLVTHFKIERRTELRRKKLEAAKESKHGLACEVCGFNFEKKYGVIGYGFAEVHHLKPLASLKLAKRISLNDLAVLCANCHRMIHQRVPLFTISELKHMLKS